MTLDLRAHIDTQEGARGLRVTVQPSPRVEEVDVRAERAGDSRDGLAAAKQLAVLLFLNLVFKALASYAQQQAISS